MKEQAAFAHLYQHKRTGAKVLSVVCPSEREKVFGAAFLTVPGDDSGVAHILEHSVLCGSARYPSKEPFVTLLASSLQTYLNAMTYPDRTVYPVASPNLADFYNLVRVYMDAVLCPRLGPWVLAQEGWHLEVVPGGKGGRALKASGVVYNEMKGVYSNADSVHAMACDAALFPDTHYSRSSGGDPLAITSLTPALFSAFHAENYHPSKARLWFFGDDPEPQRLELVEEFLAPLAAGAEAPMGGLHPAALPLQSPFEAPRWVSLPYPAAAEGAEPSAAAAEEGNSPGDYGEQLEWSVDPSLGPSGGIVSSPPPLQGGSALPQQRVARPTNPLAWDAQACTREGYGGGAATRGPAGESPEGIPASSLPNHFVTVNWCLGEVGGAHLPPRTRLGLAILSHLLMGTQTSTLRMALTDSGLGSSVTGGGYDDGGKQATFSAGLKGVAGSNVAQVEALVLHALTMTAGVGFDAAHITASVNTVEFGLREFSTGGGPRGLSLFLSSAGAWVHGRDPIEEVAYLEALEWVKQEVGRTSGGYFTELLKGFLLHNSHRATMHSWPDEHWSNRREAAERQWLSGLAAGFSEKEWEEVSATEKELVRRQETPDREEDVRKIPRLSLSDVDKKAPHLAFASVAPLSSSAASGGTLVSSLQDTAGIGYLRFNIPLPNLPQHLLPLLPLLSWSLTSMGTTQGKDEADLSRAIGGNTGGLGASYGIWETCPSGSAESLAGIPYFSLSGKALQGKGGVLGALLQECLLHGKLDRRDRVVTYLKERIARAESGLVSSGHSTAGGLLGATAGGAGGGSPS